MRCVDGCSEAFRRELERIETLNDPGRTEALVSLNDRIFRSLTGMLFADARPALEQLDAAEGASEGERVEHVIDELSARNPYFALCTGYRQAFGVRIKRCGVEPLPARNGNEIEKMRSVSRAP